MDILNHYQEKIDSTILIIEKLERKNKIAFFLRLLFFVLIILEILYLINSNFETLHIILIFLFISIFLYTVKYDVSLKRSIHFFKTLIEINKSEIEYLSNNLSHLPTGDKFIEGDHPYTSDLGIFGQNSLYQEVNRTSTYRGSIVLAKWFSTLPLTKDEITGRQEAITELKEMVDFRQKFQAIGTINVLNEADHLSIKMNNSKYSIYLLILSFAFPTFTILSIIAASFNLISAIFPALFYFAQLFIIFIFSRKIHLNATKASVVAKKIFNYYDLAMHINAYKFKSNLLQINLASIFGDKLNILKGFRKLNSLSIAFDQRNNGILFLTLNGLFLNDLHLVRRLISWNNKYHIQLERLNSVVSEVDALCSLANYYFNKPSYILPKFSDNEILLTTGLVHPLLKTQKPVGNNFNIEKFNTCFIITGANMAGKSTFLRTIGINLVLAGIGGPVAAKSFEFKPYPVFTSMENTDNLSKNTSYYYAELLRLKKIKNFVLLNGETIVLLDEILKGTNSKDKVAGSKLYVKSIIKQPIIGIIATHDLELTELSIEYPSNINNFCFEVEIINNEISCDYLIRPGVTKTFNATFLLGKLEII